jgi:MFS family permease
MASVGFVAGQVLGGVLVEWTSWRAVFLVNVPVGLAAAVLAPRLIDAVPPALAADPATGPIATSPIASGSAAAHRGRRIDLRGAVLITAAVTLAVYSMSQGDVLGWTSPLVLGAAVVAVVAGACFVVAETHHPAPLVRPRVLLRPGLRDGAALAFLLGVWNGGELLVLSLYLQQALHLSPLETGAVIAPQGLAGFSMGILGPKIAGRIGVRRMLVIAGAVTVVGFIALTRLPSAGYSPLLTVVVLVGLGSAGTAFGAMVLGTRELADTDQGLAGGVINTSRQVGAALGAALLPAVAESTTGGIAGVTGDRAAMLTGAVAALAATAVSWQAARHARATVRSA